MDNGTLIVIGLVFAVAAAFGLGFALFGFVLNLKKSNRRLRSGSQDEYVSTAPPTNLSTPRPYTKSISFGDIVDSDQITHYSPDAYISVRQPGLNSEICVICRQTIIDDNSFTCPDCGALYHYDHFTFQNSCVNCGWRPS